MNKIKSFMVIVLLLSAIVAVVGATSIRDNYSSFTSVLNVFDNYFIESDDSGNLSSLIGDCDDSCIINIPEGSYTLTSGFTIDDDVDISLVCSNRGDTVINFQPSVSSYMFTPGDNVSFSMRNCNVNGVGTNARGFLSFGAIKTNKSVNVYLENNAINSFYDYGVWLCADTHFTIGDVVIKDNVFTNVSYNHGATIEICGKKSVESSFIVDDNVMVGYLGASGNTSAIHYYMGVNDQGDNPSAGDGIVIRNNVIKDYVLDGIKVNGARNVFISGNSVSNIGRVGLACIRSHYCSANNNIVNVAGNITGLNAWGGRCYRFQSAYYSSFTGNQGYGCGGSDAAGNGLSIGGGSLMFSNNILQSSANPSVYVQASSYNITIVDNWLKGEYTDMGDGGSLSNIFYSDNHPGLLQLNDPLEDGDSSVVIASGVITIAGRSHYLVDTEGAVASDDLDTISGGVNGQILVIQSSSATRDIVVKDSTGNIFLSGDKNLNHWQDKLVLIYYNGNWNEISFSDNSV